MQSAINTSTNIQGVAVTAVEGQLVADLNNVSVRNTSSLPATVAAGEETILTGSTGSTKITLPVASSTVPNSSINTVCNASSVAVSIAPGTGNTINNFGTSITSSSSLSIPSGYTFEFVLDGTVWYVLDAGPSDFAVNNVLSTTNGGTGNANGNATTVTGFSPVSGKTLTVNNSLTLAGTDGVTITFPGTNATMARTDAANTFTGTQTFSGIILANGGTSTNGTVGSAPATPTFTTSTPKQLNTTQDAMLYVSVQTASTFSMGMGSSSTPGATNVIPSATAPIGACFAVRVPKSWYVDMVFTSADVTFATVPC